MVLEPSRKRGNCKVARLLTPRIRIGATPRHVRFIALLSCLAVGLHGSARGHEIYPLAQRSADGESSLLPIVTGGEHLLLAGSIEFGILDVGSTLARQVSLPNQTTRRLHVVVTPPSGVSVSADEFDLEPQGAADLTLTWEPPVAGDLVGDVVFTISHKGIPTFAIEALPVRGVAIDPNAFESVTWGNFEAASSEGTEPILPDFSFAGYRHANVPIPDVKGPVFDVTDPTYGAVANDGQPDRDAIQAAIDAAAAAGGGVVRFPPGVFHLNTLEERQEPIRIEHSNIVLRGSGASGAPDGTTVVMERHFALNEQCQLYSAPSMVQVGLPSGAPSPTQLATVTADARRETFTVRVNDTSRLSVGQWITLWFSNTRDEVFDSYLSPQQRPVCNPDRPETCWTRGLQIRERHKISAIEDSDVIFEDPIHIDVNVGILEAGEEWELLSYPHLEEVGIEDLLFQGGWTEPFSHHGGGDVCRITSSCVTQDCISHDSAWSAVFVDSLVDGWVRRIRFRDWNQALQLFNTSATSVLEVDFEGNGGHFSVHTRGGTGNLIGLSRDLAGHHHGPSVGYSSAGTVFWRFEYPGDTSIDAHSTSPYATLFDLAAGGLRYGRAGGPGWGMPNHLRHLVLWNFEHRGPAISPFDFWTAQPRTYFVRPIIVGFHQGLESFGGSVFFETEDIELDELHARVASPSSLFEAQLALRLGELPAWLAGLRDSER